MEFEVEVINCDVMVVESLDGAFKIVINIETGEVIHVEFTELSIQKFDKYIGQAKIRYQKYVNSKAIKGFMEGEE